MSQLKNKLCILNNKHASNGFNRRPMPLHAKDNLRSSDEKMNAIYSLSRELLLLRKQFVFCKYIFVA